MLKDRQLHSLFRVGTDIDDFAAVNAVYARHVPDPPPAASARSAPDGMSYTVTVEDDQEVDCNKVLVSYILGHDDHGHPLTLVRDRGDAEPAPRPDVHSDVGRVRRPTGRAPPAAQAAHGDATM